MVKLPSLPDPDGVFSIFDKASSAIDRGLGFIDKLESRLDRFAISEKPITIPIKAIENKATATPTGCIPCSISHYGTCTGLLNEAMRFARSDGVGSSEVIDRVNMCVDELNAMERVDLRPEMIVSLPSWEKELADKALIQSRSLRHGLENLRDSGQLEQLAAETQSVRQDIGRTWFKSKLAKMTPSEQAEIQERVIQKLKEEA